MLKTHLSRAIIAGLMAALCTVGFAFETAKGNAPAVPEFTQAQVTEQLQHNGAVPLVAESTKNAGLTSTDVKTAEERKRQENLVLTGASKGKDILVAAELQKHEGAFAPFRTTIWAILFILLGLGVVFGLKMWADKVVPAMPAKRSVKW